MSTFPAITAGQRITASLLTSMLPVFALKTADQSVTSSTVLVNDTDLFVPVVASATYAIDCYIRINGAATGTGDIKIAWTIPTSATMSYTSYGTTTSSPAVQYEATANTATTTRAVGTNGATDMGMAIKAFIVVSTTAGNVQFQWAQNTSVGTATIVRANSWMRFQRIS